MRFYSFGNYYLSQIQQGIQAAHCAVDLIYKYHDNNNPSLHFRTLSSMVNDWAINHKTMILLNGGNQEALVQFYLFLDDPRNPYPFCHFQEDQQSLNNAVTSVGIILPEKIYEGAAILRDRRTIVMSDIMTDENVKVLVPFGDLSCTHTYTEWEIELMKKLNEYRLA